jgi:hypothetical protein
MDRDKKIHIKIPDDLHRKLRTKCAYLDISLQDYVLKLLEENLSGCEIIVSESGVGSEGTNPKVPDS